MLREQLLSSQESRLTGKLQIKQSDRKDWQIYFCLGRIIWADGGEHPHRFWFNHLNKYCHRAKFKSEKIAEVQKFQCWNYRLLTTLLTEEKIALEEFDELVKSQICQVFFDILQAEAEGSLQYSFQTNYGDYLLNCGLKISLTHATILNAEKKLLKAQKQWQKWCDAGLRKISPNSAPNINKLSLLKEKVSPAVCDNFVKLIDGTRTLRDLANLLDRDLVKLTLSLMPYINEELIVLKEVGDLPIVRSQKDRSKEQTNNDRPLIACIDDSNQILMIMKKIVSDRGDRFLGIKEPLKAIPKLIAADPDLIFLDIGMPDLNGYELCSQLRKVSKLKNKPVVMLTSQDGFVDKVRAKVAGCSQFISKPIDLQLVSDVMTKFLPTKKPKRSLEQNTLIAKPISNIC
ncbi:MAG: response regulator [Prochloraceae cyanobacterium]